MRKKIGHNPTAKIIPPKGEKPAAKSAKAAPADGPAKRPSAKSLSNLKHEPKYKVDEEFLKKVKNLGRNNATYKDAAHVLGMSHQHFGRLVRENPKVTAAYEAGQAINRVSLRQKLTQMALEKDSIPAMIFLAKQTELNGGLGMSDRAEVSGTGGGPIEIKFIEGDDKL